jgi:hypothetical protein
VRFAEAQATPWPRDLRAHLESGYLEPPPNNAILGPVVPHGGPAKIIPRRGVVVASWDDMTRDDMSFSIVKCYRSLLARLANGNGRFPDLDEAISAWARQACSGNITTCG